MIPKQEGVENYKLKIKRLHLTEGFQFENIFNLKKDEGARFNHLRDKFEILLLEKSDKKLYPNSDDKYGFLQYTVKNSAGESDYYIESEISIIPILKEGYSYSRKSETKKVIFQNCNH
jgi:hypothetical protein